MKIIPKHNILNKISLFYNLQVYKDINIPDSIFFHKNGKIYFDLDLKNDCLWCSYDMIWNVFSNDNELDYSETQSVIKNILEQYTNLVSATPMACRFCMLLPLEQYTNLVSATPECTFSRRESPLEQYTILESVTPMYFKDENYSRLEQYTN